MSDYVKDCQLPNVLTCVRCGLQALQETFLIFRLAVLLYSYLGLGTRWMGKLLRLILYSMLLLPGFIQVWPSSPLSMPMHSGKGLGLVFHAYLPQSSSIASRTWMAEVFPFCQQDIDQ